MPKGATKSTKKSILEVLYRRNIDGLGALLAPPVKTFTAATDPRFLQNCGQIIRTTDLI